MPKLIWEKKLQEAVKRQQRFDWSLRYVREQFFMKEFFNISKSIKFQVN